MFRSNMSVGLGQVTSITQEAIFGSTSGAGSPLELIARRGDSAGLTDGAAFNFFSQVSLNDSGDVAFGSLLRTGTGAPVSGSNDATIFGPTSGVGSPLGLIVREGDPVPGVAGMEFDFLFTPALNASGDVVFRGGLRTGTGAPVGLDNNRGLFINSAGEQECILRSGDQITVTLPDGSGTEERTVGFVELSPTGLSDQGVVAFRVTFTDLTQGIFTTNSGPVLLGDVNLDGIVNFLDISPFIIRLTSGALLAEADINQDGIINFLDIAPFIQILANQS